MVFKALYVLTPIYVADVIHPILDLTAKVFFMSPSLALSKKMKELSRSLILSCGTFTTTSH